MEFDNEPGKTITFGLADAHVTVRVRGGGELPSDVEKLMPALLRTTDAVQAPGSISPTGPDGERQAIEVSRQGGEWVLRTGADGSEVFMSRVDLLTAVEQSVAQHILANTSDLTPIHAAGCVHGGRAVIAVGPSGAGKSSIAYRWSLSGLPVLGDDVVLLTHEGHAASFRRYFGLDPRLLLKTHEASPGLLSDLSDQEYAWFDPASCGGWADPAPVCVVALIRHRTGADLTVTPASSAQVLDALVHARLDAGTARSTAIDQCITVAGSSYGVEVEFRDAAEAASLLLGLVDEQGT